MTPAQVCRAALCLADALDTVADEMGREDACSHVITAHAGAAEEMCRALTASTSDRGYPDRCPSDADPGVIMYAMFDTEQGRPAPPAADLTRWADAWRSWGESRRAELAACPVCEEGKTEAPGPMCADLHVQIPRVDADGVCEACESMPEGTDGRANFCAYHRTHPTVPTVPR